MSEMRSQTLNADEVQLLAQLERREPAVAGKLCPPHEKRKHRRLEFFSTITARRRPSSGDEFEPPVTVHGRDLSLGGVKFVSPVEFPYESQLELYFQLPLWGDRRFVRMLAEVRHATELEPGQWVIGCQFLETLGAWPR